MARRNGDGRAATRIERNSQPEPFGRTTGTTPAPSGAAPTSEPPFDETVARLSLRKPSLRGSLRIDSALAQSCEIAHRVDPAPQALRG